jgi:hypothetical protein
MKEMNAEEICKASAAGTLTEEQAVDELIKLGFASAEAREQVFIAMGRR